jgi:hypothetical protein
MGRTDVALEDIADFYRIDPLDDLRATGQASSTKLQGEIRAPISKAVPYLR